jgi:hypothetical protein
VALVRAARLLLAAALPLAACTIGPLDPGAGARPQPSLERAVVDHYRRYASEESRICTMAEIEAITRLEVLEDQDGRLLARVRYFYRDPFRAGRDGGRCLGFGEREFLVSRSAAGYEVLDMTGELKRPIGVTVGRRP